MKGRRGFMMLARNGYLFRRAWLTVINHHLISWHDRMTECVKCHDRLRCTVVIMMHFPFALMVCWIQTALLKCWMLLCVMEWTHYDFIYCRSNLQISGNRNNWRSLMTAGRRRKEFQNGKSKARLSMLSNISEARAKNRSAPKRGILRMAVYIHFEAEDKRKIP